MAGKKEARLDRFIGIVQDRGYVSIKEMADLLHVSEMTVRRDLDTHRLGSQVRNVNGVLVPLAGQPEQDYDLLRQTTVQMEKKTRIGRFAAALVEEGDCVSFDVGTTTQQIVPHIRPDLTFEAVCLTYNVLEQLCRNPRAQVAFAGGFYHPLTQMFSSEHGLNFIRSLRANKYFVSAAGIHPTLGISCANSYEVPAKHALLQSGNQHILVADSSKFGVVRSGYFCDLSDIHMVITDTDLDPQWIHLLQEKGITLQLV